MQKFRPLKIESILDQIDRGSPLDLGYVQWDSAQERYIANRSGAARKAPAVPLPSLDSIMAEINNKTKRK